MTPATDPYRALGIDPGASLNEIRSAYRRMVKKYHPDAAGERALPRFLAIQTAYERLVDGEGRLRAGRRPSTPRAAPQPAGPAGQARDRAGPRRRAPADGAADPPPSGERARAGNRGRGGEAHATGRRTTRKATPGSTTYDEAAGMPLDPPWDGGAWYGPSSGTFWTLNPREYADPRKHGPEYEARARRASTRGRTGRQAPADEVAPGDTRPGGAEPSGGSDPAP